MLELRVVAGPSRATHSIHETSLPGLFEPLDFTIHVDYTIRVGFKCAA